MVDFAAIFTACALTAKNLTAGNLTRYQLYMAELVICPFGSGTPAFSPRVLVAMG